MTELDDTQPLPLCVRALHWSLVEASRCGKAPVPRTRVAEYLAGCERGGRPIGDFLVGLYRTQAVSFCAAATGFSERSVALPGEVLPPWRAGALEYMRDAQAGLRGRWLPAAKALAGEELPPPGSLVIYTRPGAPGSGHVERLIECDGRGYKSVGANEGGGKWIVDVEPVPFSHPRLLGFVVHAEETASSPLVVPAEPERTESEFVELVDLDVPWDAIEAERKAAVRNG